MFHHAMPSYNAEKFAALVESTQATMFSGVPSVVLTLASGDLTSKYDFSRAQVINVGGAPFKADMVKRLYELAPWRLNQVYGMTEAAGYVAYQRLNEALPEGLVGSFLPNVQARLVKEGTCEDVPKGSPGELLVRGPNITRGYAFNEEASAKAFPDEGWYNTGEPESILVHSWNADLIATGDVCVIDDKCRVGVVGRTKDLIKYKGFQISPAELESHLNTHELVAEAGVGGIWDESQLTELPAAWVVLKKSNATDLDVKSSLRRVHDAIDAQVSGYKKLRGGVWAVGALPKTATGKILRKEMAAMRGGMCSLDRRVLARL
jgi:acyl-CoA synthetase (AMP-forming)/AMP-acid ligase II